MPGVSDGTAEDYDEWWSARERLQALYDVLAQRPLQKLFYGLDKYKIPHSVSGRVSQYNKVRLTIDVGAKSKITVVLSDDIRGKSDVIKAEILANRDDTVCVYSDVTKSFPSGFALRIADMVRKGMAQLLEAQSRPFLSRLFEIEKNPLEVAAKNYLDDYNNALQASQVILYTHLRDIFKATRMEAEYEGCSAVSSQTKASDTGQPVEVFNLSDPNENYERLTVHAQFQDDDSDEISLRAAFESSRQFKDVTVLEAIAMADEWFDRRRNGTLGHYIPSVDKR